MVDYVFGEIPGNPLGIEYESRKVAAKAGVHRVTIQGISGNRADGADSIVVSGGYEDDEDHGDVIFYTGAGGNDTATKKQISNQTLDQTGNAGLVVSEENGYPVRVIRGFKGDPQYSPSSGYRYDGLYRVAQHWAEIGKSGFRVWRFKLVRLTPEESGPYLPPENLPFGNSHPARTLGVVQRIVRSTKVADSVKKLYKFTCQICNVELNLPVGHYAEAAHIRALGKPHDGPDTPDNVLCLCPNHHAVFDLGGIYIDEELQVRDYAGNLLGSGRLTLHESHSVNPEHAKYHRNSFGIE